MPSDGVETLTFRVRWGAAAPDEVDVRGVRRGRGSVVRPEAGRRPVVRARPEAATRRGRGGTIGLLVAALVWSIAPGAAAVEDRAGADPDDRADEAATDEAATEAADAAEAAEAAEAARLAVVEAAARAVRDAEAELTRARAGLRDARATLRSAEAGGTAADGRVRAAEEALPPLVVARRTLHAEVTAIDAELRQLRAAERRARDELVTARDALSDQAIATFKTGRSAELLGPVAVLREARDPGQLVRGLADLRAVTRDGARSVRSLERELRELATTSRELRARRTSLAAELDEATDAVEGGEAGTAAARSTAGAAERRLVAAMEAELAARRALERAEERHAARLAAAADLRADTDAVDAEGLAAEGPGPAALERGDPANDEDAEVPPEAGALASQVAGRRRALERAERLTAEQRRTAEAWHCPVDEARFVNDWAFPRSGLRRHEGTDVFGDRGTPILAVTGGTVTVLDATDGRGDLGGITVTVADGDGRQYYAHLERLDPDLRRGDEVRPGDRLGWVGTSGNARGTPPHLHLGWYVDDVAVNPYASLAVACDGRSRPVREGDTVPADASDESVVGRAEADAQGAGADRSPVAGAGGDQGWRTPSPARTAR